MDPRIDRTALRTRLYDNGFTPLPNRRKACFLDDWPRVEVDHAVIEQWGRKRAWMDTGVRCGDVVAVDLDIDDADLLDRLAEAINQSGIVVESPFVRVGRAPREMWVYRAAGEPVGKRTTGSFVRPGAPDGEHVQLEVLGKGNQFGAYGEHSDGVLYSWPEQDLLDAKFMDLPTIGREQVEKLIAFAAAFFEHRGYQRHTAGGHTDGHYTRVFDLEPGMVFTVRDLGPMTVAELESYFANSPDDVLRCTVEALRETGGSWAGMASAVGGVLCISDHGDQVAHYPARLGGEDDPMKRLGRLLAEKFPEPEPMPEGVEKVEMPLPPPRELRPGQPLDDNLAIALERFIYVESEDQIRDRLKPREKFTPAHFRNLVSQFYDVQAGPRGGKHFDWLSDLWIRHARRFNVQTAALRPDRPAPLYSENGAVHFNTWSPRILPTHGDSAPGFDMLARLLPDPDERRWFTQWLSHKLRRPDVRGPGVIMVANNAYGTGRGSLVDLMADMLGDEYVRVVPFGTLAGRNYQSQYNQWLSDSLIVAVSEAQEDTDRSGTSWRSRSAAYEHLKTIIDPGSHKVEIVRKGVDNYQGKTFASVFVATNHFDALVVPRNDRRLAVLENGQLQPSDYWRGFHAWRGDLANVGAFRAALLAVDLEGYNPYEAPPMTRAKGDMVHAGTSDLDRAALAVIARAPGRYLVREQFVLMVEDYAREVVLDLPESWREVTAHVFTRMGRRLDGLFTCADGRQREVRDLRHAAGDAMPDGKTVLEELARNGPLTRPLAVASSGKVVDFPRRGQG